MTTTLVVASLVGLLPATVSAQVLVARVVLYEVREALQFRGPRIDLDNPDPAKLQRRVADAGLLGTAVTELNGPSPFGEADLVVAEATSNINMKIGKGPIRGAFQLLKYVEQLNGTGADNFAHYVVTSDGQLSGTLDLSAGGPFATASGTWSLKGSKAGGNKTFIGVFLIPVMTDWGPVYVLPPPPEGYAEQALYQALFNGACTAENYVFEGICRVGHDETILRFPLTKLLILLLE